MKHHTGQRPSVYYWRDHNGIEVDCIVEDVVCLQITIRSIENGRVAEVLKINLPKTEMKKRQKRK